MDILIVDSDPVTREAAREILGLNGFEVRIADSPGEALRSISEREPELILTDLYFPDSDPKEYLAALEIWVPHSVLLLYTSHLESTLPARVFDLVRKSANGQQIVSAALRANDFQRELAKTNELENLHRSEFVNRLTWLLWKRRTDSRGMIDYGRRVISNLRHSITQGAGIGGMLTQVQLALMKKPDASGQRALSPELGSMLEESVVAVRAWLHSLERFSQLKHAHYVVEDLDAQDVRSVLEESVASVERFRVVRGQELKIDSIRFDGCVQSNREALGLTLRELLTNAFKYSTPNSIVNIAELRSGRTISIVVINDAMPEKDPMDLSGDAFLPFARTGNIYQDEFLDEELGLGIGLPVIQEAMQQTGGAVFLRRIQSHTESAPRSRIMAEVLLSVREN